jgi:hypothetical protein
MSLNLIIQVTISVLSLALGGVGALSLLSYFLRQRRTAQRIPIRIKR